MEFANLDYEVEEGVARITLAREKVGNALDLALCRELQEAALACQEDPAVRAVVLTGRGRVFCAGGDLSAFASAGDDAPALLKRMTIHLHAAISLFARMDPPVVAAVGGTAAGAGFSLTCAADLAVAGESAKFTLAYTRAGLTPDGGSTSILPQLVGRRRTLELMLTNRVLTAPEALEWGLVNQVVADDAVLETATALAVELARGATAAFGDTKRLVLSASAESLETQLELEARSISAASARPDGREGIAAFLGKRAPRFTGS